MTNVTDLVFPFWIVTQRRGLISLPVEPDGMPGYIAAFTTAEKGASFMAQRGETEWECKMVSRSTLMSVMEELRGMIGMRGICIDAVREDPGKRFTFEEMDRQGNRNPPAVSAG